MSLKPHLVSPESYILSPDTESILEDLHNQTSFEEIELNEIPSNNSQSIVESSSSMAKKISISKGDGQKIIVPEKYRRDSRKRRIVKVEKTL